MGTEITLKPCQNCGSTNLHHYTASRRVECNDCLERRSEADWQDLTPLEDALLAENARLKAVIAAQDKLIESLEWGLECCKFRGTFVGKMHGPAYQAICASSVHAIGVAHDARAKLAAMEEQCPEQS